jgi:hypothetical protein
MCHVLTCRHENLRVFADTTTDGNLSAHVGYVSLFPVLLGIVPRDSPMVCAWYVCAWVSG